MFSSVELTAPLGITVLGEHLLVEVRKHGNHLLHQDDCGDSFFGHQRQVGAASW
ncbi:hypothetical protein M6B38_325680 [Iris pallida]|uniref:Uncharacterized protein n=1 Tax=Iris pallida TaxID=29817 RepID=A0AAX6GNH9_IRIPA|nr:hypothetical protein M6B38_125935 [Iris pallida]KAJ6836952.1 hypothetical protein M6B38_325680 [Iris pallida]